MDNRAGEMRWQAERRAAMETSVSYWNAKKRPRQLSTSSEGSESVLDNAVKQGNDEVDIDTNSKAVGIRGCIVWAGLEPLELISLFPEWVRRSDVAQINVQVRRSLLLTAIYLNSILSNVNIECFLVHKLLGWSKRNSSSHRCSSVAAHPEGVSIVRSSIEALAGRMRSNALGNLFKGRGLCTGPWHRSNGIRTTTALEANQS